MNKNPIADIIEKVQSSDYDKEILVVDDASADDTKDVLPKLGQQPEIKKYFFLIRPVLF